MCSYLIHTRGTSYNLKKQKTKKKKIGARKPPDCLARATEEFRHSCLETLSLACVVESGINLVWRRGAALQGRYVASRRRPGASSKKETQNTKYYKKMKKKQKQKQKSLGKTRDTFN